MYHNLTYTFSFNNSWHNHTKCFPLPVGMIHSKSFPNSIPCNVLHWFWGFLGKAPVEGSVGVRHPGVQESCKQARMQGPPWDLKYMVKLTWGTPLTKIHYGPPTCRSKCTYGPNRSNWNVLWPHGSWGLGATASPICRKQIVLFKLYTPMAHFSALKVYDHIIPTIPTGFPFISRNQGGQNPPATSQMTSLPIMGYSVPFLFHLIPR